MPKPRTKAVANAEMKREPNEREKRAIAAAEASRKVRPARAQYGEAPSETPGAFHVDAPHADADGLAALVAETFGTTSDAFIGHAMLHLAQATANKDGKPQIEAFNAGLAMIGAIAPRDELEAALAVEMAMTHELSVEMLRRTKNAQYVEGMREYGNLATKLQRTFAAQLKQLSDWRRGGEQVIVHRHVHVSDGGQAVVADTINVGGRGNENGSFKPHEQGAVIPAMLGDQSSGQALPVPCDARAQTLSPTWRKGKRGRGAKGEQE